MINALLKGVNHVPGLYPAWERGRLARMLSLWPPLSFGAMPQAATLWARTPAARPKESHGAVPG